MTKTQIQNRIQELTLLDLIIFTSHLAKVGIAVKQDPTKSRLTLDIGQFTLDEFYRRRQNPPEFSVAPKRKPLSRYEGNIFCYLGVNDWNELIESYN